MPEPTELTPQRRSVLAAKARALYGKYCGTRGRGICCESFAVYHLARGEVEAVTELLAFLDEEIERLQASDPEHRLTMTSSLTARIRQHWNNELNG